MKTDIISAIIDKITLVNTESEEQLILSSLEASESPTIVSFVNAHAFNLCFSNMNFATAVYNSQFIFRDGIGMKFLFQNKKQAPGLNMNGTDFIPKILNRSLGKRIAIYGTQQPHLDIAVETLGKLGHKIVSIHDGFSTPETYVQMAMEAKPDIIVLGMGMPKQELISALLQINLTGACIIINGGAILDFLANRVRRAPKWVREIGMEWCYRLINEPRRLFKRYVLGNFVFFYNLIQLRNHGS